MTMHRSTDPSKKVPLAVCIYGPSIKRLEAAQMKRECALWSVGSLPRVPERGEQGCTFPSRLFRADVPSIISTHPRPTFYQLIRALKAVRRPSLRRTPPPSIRRFYGHGTIASNVDAGLTCRGAGGCSRNLSGAARNALTDTNTGWRCRKFERYAWTFEHLRQRLKHGHPLLGSGRRIPLPGTAHPVFDVLKNPSVALNFFTTHTPTYSIFKRCQKQRAEVPTHSLVGWLPQFLGRARAVVASALCKGHSTVGGALGGCPRSYAVRARRNK
ncbi:hypothetical protein BJY52DRAFT_1225804 [Lactarius psammicola]|nr:hypothetical protein BJY52DRAFT_1225804 [Lactarius psammicola]